MATQGPKRYYVVRDIVPYYASTTGRDEEIWLVKDRETGESVDCGMTSSQGKARARAMERQDTELESSPFLPTILFCSDIEEGYVADCKREDRTRRGKKHWNVI